MKNQETVEKPISQTDMMNFLNIKGPALLRLRKNGSIPYISVGGKFMYQPGKVVEALTTKSNCNG